MARSGKQKRVVFTPIRGYLVAVKMEIPARPWNESRIQRDSKIFLLSRADGWTREKERERRQATRDEGRNKRWLKKSNRKRVCIRVCVYRLLFRDTRRNLIARKQRERERKEEERTRVMEEWRYRAAWRICSRRRAWNITKVTRLSGRRVFVQFSSAPIKPFPICRARSCNSTSNGIRVKNNRERLRVKVE